MDKIKKAISTGKMVPKRDILSMVRYEGKGLKKLGFTKKANWFWRTATWPFKKGVGYTRKTVKNTVKNVKDHPVKSGGAALGWIFDPGYELKNALEIETEPNIFDDFVTFGFPVTEMMFGSGRPKSTPTPEQIEKGKRQRGERNTSTYDWDSSGTRKLMK